jgi:hypothetical protein
MTRPFGLELVFEVLAYLDRPLTTEGRKEFRETIEQFEDLESGQMMVRARDIGPDHVGMKMTVWVDGKQEGGIITDVPRPHPSDGGSLRERLLMGHEVYFAVDGKLAYLKGQDSVLLEQP